MNMIISVTKVKRICKIYLNTWSVQSNIIWYQFLEHSLWTGHFSESSMEHYRHSTHLTYTFDTFVAVLEGAAWGLHSYQISHLLFWFESMERLSYLFEFIQWVQDEPVPLTKWFWCVCFFYFWSKKPKSALIPLSRKNTVSSVRGKDPSWTHRKTCLIFTSGVGVGFLDCDWSDTAWPSHWILALGMFPLGTQLGQGQTTQWTSGWRSWTSSWLTSNSNCSLVREPWLVHCPITLCLQLCEILQQKPPGWAQSVQGPKSSSTTVLIS